MNINKTVNGNELARAALDQFKMEAAREVGVQSPLEENIQHMERSAKT